MTNELNPFLSCFLTYFKSLHHHSTSSWLIVSRCGAMACKPTWCRITNRSCLATTHEINICCGRAHSVMVCPYVETAPARDRTLVPQITAPISCATVWKGPMLPWSSAGWSSRPACFDGLRLIQGGDVSPPGRVFFLDQHTLDSFLILVAARASKRMWQSLFGQSIHCPKRVNIIDILYYNYPKWFPKLSIRTVNV